MAKGIVAAYIDQQRAAGLVTVRRDDLAVLSGDARWISDELDRDWDHDDTDRLVGNVRITADELAGRLAALAGTDVADGR